VQPRRLLQFLVPVPLCSAAPSTRKRASRTANAVKGREDSPGETIRCDLASGVDTSANALLNLLPRFRQEGVRYPDGRARVSLNGFCAVPKASTSCFLLPLKTAGAFQGIGIPAERRALVGVYTFETRARNMTDKPENLILELLHAIRGHLGQVKDDPVNIELRLSSFEGQTANLHGDNVIAHQRRITHEDNTHR